MSTTDIFGDNGILSERTSRGAKVLKTLLLVTTLVTWGIVLYYATTQAMSRARYGVLFLGLMILIYVVSEMVDAYDEDETITVVWLAILGLITVFVTGYIYVEFMELITDRVGWAFDYEYVIAAAMGIVISYLTYREYGIAFLGVFLFSIFYGMFGAYFPGIFGHGGFSTTRILRILVLELQGFYGSLNQIVAAWIALFLLYAGLLRGYGAFDLIIRVAFKAAEYARSGVAQSAVIASLIVGSINGSAAANAAMTGSFTIPLMEKSGMKGESAAGIESVASSGGQIMPPVMGAAAFVMASILGIAYWEVLVAALVPAAIFFISVAIAVHYTAIGQITDYELDVEKHVDEMKDKKQFTWEFVRFLIPFAILIYLLGIAQWTIMTAGLYTVIAMIITGLIFPILEAATTEDASPTTALKEELIHTIDGFVYGGKILAPIAIIVAAINVVVDIFQATGVPGALSLALLDYSGGILIIAVLLAMVICILLGMGMPTVAAYTIVALLIAPTIASNFVVPELAVHFFVFYAAILSGLTPPIAIAVVVASGVAESDFWGTCIEALKVAAPLYVLPIAFIFNPELIVGGITVSNLLTILFTILGAVTISHGLNYYGNILGLHGHLESAGRAFFFAIGTVAMVYPTMYIQAALALLGGGLIVFQHLNPKAILLSGKPE